MDKINVPIFIESRYKVNRKLIKERVTRVLKDYGIHGPVEVSVAVVGDRKMRELNKKYRNLDKTTNVLSFSQLEGETALSKDEITALGDIVISYPQVIEEAAAYDQLVDDRVLYLVEHGLQHLLGIHHPGDGM